MSYFILIIAAIVFVLIAIGVWKLVVPKNDNIMPDDWEHKTLDDKYNEDMLKGDQLRASMMAPSDIAAMANRLRENQNIKSCAMVATMPFKQPRKQRSDKGKKRGKRVAVRAKK